MTTSIQRINLGDVTLEVDNHVSLVLFKRNWYICCIDVHARPGIRLYESIGDSRLVRDAWGRIICV